MRGRLPALRSAALAWALYAALAGAAAPGSARQPSINLGAAHQVAPGVALYHLTDRTIVNPPAPIAIWLLRADLAVVDLRPVLANDEIVDTETVADTAVRHGAIAAVNGGFFLLPSGDPAGIYKLSGQLVSDTRRPRGAVGIIRKAAVPRLIFGRVSATMSLRIPKRLRPDEEVEIAGVDTTRQRRKLMLFTPAYHDNTDMAPGGLEWVVDGRPLRVIGRPHTAGKTPIPRKGYVLSFGGLRAPPPLTLLKPGTIVEFDTRYVPVEGRARDWAAAQDIIGGAGLLLLDGKAVSDWSMEKFSEGFAETRHPRTLIGTHADGSVWLVTADGRQPKLSVGMTLPELRDLAERIGLVNALNLDGGGSTTMWANGEIKNSPSDAAGPRKVSDALLIVKRSLVR